MISFVTPSQQNKSKTMHFSKIFQPAQTLPQKRDSRVHPVQTSEQLLNTVARLPLINEIQDLCGANTRDYPIFYGELIKRFAEFVQLLEQYDHPSQTWLDHHLRLAKTALKMREQFLLVGESLHPVASQEEALWHYVVFSSALLRKIGLIFTHYKVSICNEQGQHTANWNAFNGAMKDQGNYYKLQEISTQDVPYTENISLLLARQLMPAEGFAWIASNPQALMAWLGIVEGEGSGGVSNRFVALSEQQLYELAAREALLEEFFHTEKLEDLLHAHNLTEQEFLALLPPLHGLETNVLMPTTQEGVAFYGWLNNGVHNGTVDTNQTSSFVQISLGVQKQFLISASALAAFARTETAQHSQINWTTLYKRALPLLGLTTLTPTDRSLQIFLARSAQMDNAAPTHAHKSIEALQAAQTQQRHTQQTISGFNYAGYVLGGMQGALNQTALGNRAAMQTQGLEIKAHQQLKDSEQIDKTLDLEKQDFYTRQEQMLAARQQQLRTQLAQQYPVADNAPVMKSHFTYIKNP